MELPKQLNKFENELIVVTVFKIKDKTQPLTEDTNRIVLKQFIEDIKNDELQDEQLEKLNQIKRVMPLAHFDQSAFYRTNLDNYQCKFGYMSEIDVALQLLGKDQVVYESRQVIKGVGCQHYVVGCKQKCPECFKFYFCRQCHNEEEDHTLPRERVQTLLCCYCDRETPFGQFCSHCGTKFCSELCPICKFMCFIGKDAKPYFHCAKCNVCRQGDEQQWIHCDKCCRCIFGKDFATHQCRPRNLPDSCPICMGPMKDTVYVVSQMNCGHYLHNHCWKKLLQEHSYLCPVCKKYSISQNQQQQIADYYEEQNNNLFCIPTGVQIQCQECSKSFLFFKQPFYKCVYCYSFNTVETATASTIDAEEQMKTFDVKPRFLTPDLLCKMIVTECAVGDKLELLQRKIQKMYDVDQGVGLSIMFAHMGLRQFCQQIMVELSFEEIIK